MAAPVSTPRPLIAVFGGSFNPPTIVHTQIAKDLSATFDQVIVVPCGTGVMSADDYISQGHRAALVDLSFSGISPKVVVDLFDLEEKNWTPTNQLIHKYEKRGEVWFVVGMDLVVPGDDGLSVILRKWEDGELLWNSTRFVIVEREGFAHPTLDKLPKTYKFFTCSIPSNNISSGTFISCSINWFLSKPHIEKLLPEKEFTTDSPSRITLLSKWKNTLNISVYSEASHPQLHYLFRPGKFVPCFTGTT